MKPLIGVLHTQNLSSAAWILISCAVVQIRMRVLQLVQKMSIFILQNAVTEFYSNEIEPAGGLLALLWRCIFFDLYYFHTFFKVSFLCSLFSHCFNCINGKIWEPSGGQNNICKSHSALMTSAWSSDKVNSVGVALLICLITFLLFCPCTFVHTLYVITSGTQNALNLSRQLKQRGFYCGWRSVGL